MLLSVVVVVVVEVVVVAPDVIEQARDVGEAALGDVDDVVEARPVLQQPAGPARDEDRGRVLLRQVLDKVLGRLQELRDSTIQQTLGAKETTSSKQIMLGRSCPV